MRVWTGTCSLTHSFPTQPKRKNPTMSTLADLARNLISSKLTRNQLKVVRARLRRMGLTHLNAERGPYAISHASDEMTARTVEPVAIVQAIAEAA